MNERIRELEAQCWTQRLTEHGPPWFDAEKFAELIVRECAQFVFVLDAEPVSHKIAARMLQEHFGVE